MPTPRWFHALAVGGPDLVSGEGLGRRPLVLAIAVVDFMRWTRIPPRAPSVLSVIGRTDPRHLTAAFRVPLLTTWSLVTLASVIVARRGTPAR